MPLKDGYFYEFGPYRIEPASGQLLRGDESLALTPKAFDTLLVLVENAGRALEKDELLRRVWPDAFVEEGSLTQNISVLRKVLGEEGGPYIETLPKRGYRFAAAVRQLPQSQESLLVDEHTVTRVVTEIETTGSGLPWNRLAAAIVLLLTVAAIAHVLTRRNPAPPVRSLAVLPLKTLPSSTEQRHLELGIADSVIGKVSEIPELTVRPIAAVRQYIQPGADPLRAGRDLKVDAILDGTLQLAGDRIRVNLNLLQTASGASLWTQTFDAPLRGIFEMEDEIAANVARQLRLRLDSTLQPRPPRRSTKNPEAYEHYLKGLYSNEAPRSSSRAAIETAIVRFRKATELDPSFAGAWAQLAICYNELVIFHDSDRPLAEAAENAAGRAAALDPDLPELLFFRAQSLWSWKGGYQVEKAIRELRRGAGHNDAAVRSLLGVLYSHVGLERQAIAESRRAMEIEPANALYADRLAAAYVSLGRYQEARDAYDRAFAMESEEKGNLGMSAIPWIHTRDFQQARRRLEKARARNPRQIVALAHLALLDALEGRFPEAEAAIPNDTVETAKFRDGHHAFIAYAEIQSLLGHSPEAVRWLQAAVDTGMPNYPLFAGDPFLGGIRRSPEFERFMAGLKTRWDGMATEFR